MASSIGGITVSIIRGLPEKARTRVTTWISPGVNGTGVMTLGSGDAEFRLQSIFYAANNAAADAHIASLIALQGTLVTVVDDWTGVYPAVAVIRCEPSQPGGKTKVIWNANANAVRVQMDWQMIGTV